MNGNEFHDEIKGLVNVGDAVTVQFRMAYFPVSHPETISRVVVSYGCKIWRFAGRRKHRPATGFSKIYSNLGQR
jgi:hypothetical protein